MKFGRKRDQRRMLLKNLADSLILNESISTTVPKAKAVISYTEKLITKAKKNDLANRRQIISALSTKAAAHKLVDEMAPKLKARQSGYLKLQRTSARRGDNAPLAMVSFVDSLKADKSKKSTDESDASVKKAKSIPKGKQ